MPLFLHMQKSNFLMKQGIYFLQTSKCYSLSYPLQNKVLGLYTVFSPSVLPSFCLSQHSKIFKVLCTMKLPYEITWSQGCRKIQTVHFLCGISAIFGGRKSAARHPRLLQGTHDILTTDVRVCTYIFVWQMQ